MVWFLNSVFCSTSSFQSFVGIYLTCLLTTEGFEVARSSQNKETNPDIPRTEANEAVVASVCNDFTVNSYKEAINLIGAFDNNPRSICMGSSNYYGTRTLDTQPELGLSLRQPDPSCLTDPKYRESNTVRRSDVSAFSR